MIEHPNAAIVRRGYAAFSTGDVATLAEVIAANAIWHSPGKNPLSGDYQGFETILGYFTKFATLSQGQFQVEVKDILANDDRAVALTRDTATRNGKTLSWDGGAIFHLRDGKLCEAWAFNLNQYLVDEFWT